MFHASSKRDRKKSVWSSSKSTRRRSSTVNYSSSSEQGCLIPIIAILLIIVVVIVLIPSCSSEKATDNFSDNNTSATSENIETTQLDLSVFADDPNISGEIYIEKEYDSWVLEITGVCANNSNKSIQEMLLYLVCCENDDEPIDSYKYTERLSLKNLAAGETRSVDWTSGTTTYGKKTFVLYVGYILYEDGSEWGTEKINHEAVVTRGMCIPLTYKEVEKASWKE